MTIKYLYNCYNLATQVSRSAAEHVLEFNRQIENVPKYSKNATTRILDLYEQCRWYMIGLYEASHTIVFSVLVKVTDNDRQRIEAYICEIIEETGKNKEVSNG
ncbi:MAG: hypothetical protein J6U54_07705 [Clostridiales bacterium]|nr:hypothetical protein [Clostridiales bacterium]